MTAGSEQSTFQVSRTLGLTTVSGQSSSIPCPLHLVIFLPFTGPARTSQPPLHLPPRLDLPALAISLQVFLDEGLSNSSHRVYSAGWRKYLSFVEAFSLEAYPIDEEKVTLFVAFLGVQGLSISTILPICPLPFSSTC